MDWNKLSQEELKKMMGDEDWVVRREVAKRIDQEGLKEMAKDENLLVRQWVEDRLVS